MHSSRVIAFRHLLVDNPAPRRHPLHVPSRNRASVSHAVAVLHGPCQYISDGFNPAVRMPGKARQVILRHIVAEVTQKQEGVKPRGVADPEGATKMTSCALHRGF